MEKNRPAENSKPQSNYSQNSSDQQGQHQQLIQQNTLQQTLDPAQQEAERIKKLIVQVCEEGPENYIQNIQKLISQILNYLNNKKKETQDIIIKYFVESICLINMKSSIYATIIALLNSKSMSNLCETVIEKVFERFQTALDNGEIIVSKNIIIFLGELMNIGMINSYSFLTMLFEIYNEAEKTIQQSKDYYLQIIISVIPYFMEGLTEKSGMEFQSFLDNIDQLMQKRDKVHYQILTPFQKSSYVDRLSLQWIELQSILKNNQINFLINYSRPYKSFQEELNNIKQIKKTIKINFNNKNVQKCMFMSPVYISFSDEEQSTIQEVKISDTIETTKEKKEENPKPNSEINLLERLLNQENISDIFELFYLNKAILIQRLSFYVRHQSSNSNQAMKLVFETIISEILKLPDSYKKIVIYASVAVTWFQEDQQIGAIMEQIFTSLMYKLEKLEPELIDRLTDFLSYYLNCIQLKWNWEQQQLICSDDDFSQKKMFYQMLFTKLSSLTSRQKLQELTPIDFHKFIMLEKDKLINLRYLSLDKIEESTNKTVVAICGKLQLKTPSNEMIEFLKSGELINETQDLQQVQKIFLECLFKRMYISFTHLNVLFDRYKDLFAEYSQNEKFQNILIESIFFFWKNSSFHLIKYLEKFTVNNFIQTEFLIEWIFNQIEKNQDNKEQNFQFWEIIRKLMDTLVNNSKNLLINADINQNEQQNQSKSAMQSEEQKGESDQEEEEKQDLHQQAQIAKQKEGDILLIIFKRFSECFSEDEDKNEVYLTRLREFCRAYCKRLAPYWEAIEEEFQTCADEVKDVIKCVKFLLVK